MMKITAFGAMAAALILSACTPEQNALNAPPGTYKKDITSTDDAGTTIRQQQLTDVSVDRYGRKRAVVESRTTEDPKGLFNKSTVSQSRRVVEEE
jgi:hypothetical protein